MLQNDVSMFGPLTANLTLRVNSTDRVNVFYKEKHHLPFMFYVCVLLQLSDFCSHILDSAQPRCPFCWICCGILCHDSPAVFGVFGHKSNRFQNTTEPSSTESTKEYFLFLTNTKPKLYVFFC